MIEIKYNDICDYVSNIQNLYDLFMEEEVINNKVLVFLSYLPIIEDIEIYFPYEETGEVRLRFNNNKNLTIYSDYIANKIYEIYFEY